MNPEELLKRHKAVIPEWISLYYDEPMELTHGEGFKVWDSEGNEYLDFFGGIVTTISGHNIPEIVEAVREQAGKILHSSTLYLIENQVKLAEKLISLSPISGDQKVFFVSSGSEANEAALLFATQHRRSSEIIALRGSYHGGSFGTMGITGQGSWRPTSRSALDVTYAMPPHHSYSSLYGPYKKGDPDFARACADDLRNVIQTSTTGHVAAFIAEPIQGVGGFIELPPEYIVGVKEVLDETGIPYISDEVQTAFGRTGSHFWGIEESGIEPDMITMAKGLGNGLAIGAVMGRADIIDSISGKLHVSTFGGNHVSSAGALANIEYILENDLQKNADEVGGYLKDRLLQMADSPLVGEVRGRGLMLALEMIETDGGPNPTAAARFMQACRERGVLVGKGGIGGNALRISPPLTITREAAKQAADIFEEALAEIGSRERVG